MSAQELENPGTLGAACRRLSLLLQQLAVLAQMPEVDDGFNAARVAYVDAENTLDPYGMAQFAEALPLDPTRALRGGYQAKI